MSVEIIKNDRYAVLLCNTTEQAFGPAFSPDEDIQKFLEWLPEDARRYSQQELTDLQQKWYDEGNQAMYTSSEVMQ